MGGVAEELRGGRVNSVRRSGNAVVRTLSPNSGFVHALLDFFAGSGWPGAPRLLGTDGTEEVVSFVDGEVPWAEPVPDWALTDDALRALARLVRGLHDLTAGSSLAGTAEVVCHHDLSPSNTVYREVGGALTPIAFLDWDLAGPGRRIEDVAHVCWQWLDLGPRVTDIPEARRRIAIICDAYGLENTGDLLPTVVWWQHKCWRGIESAADQGDPAMRRLVLDGVSGGVRDAEVWTRAHLTALTPLPADRPLPG